MKQTQKEKGCKIQVTTVTYIEIFKHKMWNSGGNSSREWDITEKGKR